MGQLAKSIYSHGIEKRVELAVILASGVLARIIAIGVLLVLPYKLDHYYCATAIASSSVSSACQSFGQIAMQDKALIAIEVARHSHAIFIMKRGLLRREIRRSRIWPLFLGPWLAGQFSWEISQTRRDKTGIVSNVTISS